MSSTTIARISSATDPKKEIQSLMKDSAKDVDVLHGKVLVALYITPEKSKGGIILTDKTKEEDIWQGMVGLVIKKGRIAFKDDENTKFGGADLKENEDWVAFTPGDGRRIQINGVDCRVIEDTQILMKVKDPAIITHYK
jgi:co-chaperonin GroES (HSP10)